MTNSAETQLLQQTLHQSKVDRAKRQLPSEKLIEGARLYDLARLQTLSAIAGDHPDWSRDQVRDEYRRRMKLVRDHEERGVYTIVEDCADRD